MCRKRLWKSIVAGTLSLTMVLSLIGTGSAVSAAEMETAGTENLTVMEETEDADAAETATGDIALTAEYFPDANFRSYLAENMDVDGDEVLSQGERDACTGIYVDSMDITDLTGIGYFTELRYLTCGENNLSSLNVSANTKLASLQCAGNNLDSLNVSANTELTTLSCYDNNLSSLNVSANTKLASLQCAENNLDSLEVSANTELEDLNCGYNNLSSLNVSANTKLTYLYCNGNNLSSLNVSANTGLTYLDCIDNNLDSLDVSANTELTYFSCGKNNLSSLNISGNTELTTLDCEKNNLSSLDVSANTQLTYLRCNNNNLSNLDVSANTELEDLYCYNNCYYIRKDFSGLDLSTLPGLVVSKISNVSGGQISGTALTFDSESTEVRYTYDCGNDFSEEFTISATLEGDIPLTAEYFPDAKFRSYLAENVDKDSNEVLSQEERDACTEIDVDSMEIADLTGIGYFMKLTYLSCNENKLLRLDVSGNSLRRLDISGNTSLTSLSCNENSLSRLDVSGDTALTTLDCSNNNLSSLDVSGNKALTTLDCGWNALSSLDVSTNTELTTLDCIGNYLSRLDVSGDTALTTLGCGNNNLDSLNVSANTKLEKLQCYSNNLSSLDVSGDTALTTLDCSDNNLSSLDVSENTELTELSCGSNNLSSLDVSANTELTELSCNDNCYYISEDSSELDLSMLPGFVVSKVSDVSGGQISGTVLTFDSDETEVTYTYDCGNDFSADFTISATLEGATINVTDIILNKTSVSLVKGADIQLEARVAPEDATDKSVTWTTSNINVATVSTDGKVTAVAAGDATITCIAADDSGVEATCQVTVTNPITKITLNKTKASVFKGKTVQLKATITPSDATDTSVTWTTSNSKVATVSTSGKVTAKTVGTATITCTAKDGSGKKATCQITVTNPVTKVKLNQTQASLSPKETLTLKATVTPTNATNKAVTWKSSNMKVATVSSSGKVTAKSAGTATITCTAKDGSGKKATCKITVYTNTEAFVARIYTKALSRTPEEAGLKYWTEEINSGRKTPVEVAESFFFAPEFTNKNLSDAEYVKVLYRTFMGREYDQGGLDYWLARLKKGESRKSVLESFAGCQEFKDIVKSFGL